MPLIFTVLSVLAVIWTTVYTFSFAISEIKNARPKAGLACILLMAALIFSFFSAF